MKMVIIIIIYVRYPTQQRPFWKADCRSVFK
jgi:hypothetical protein